jgi:azurin
MTLPMVRILGWLVIAHGLSHSVLPMRGSLAPTVNGDWVPIALYAVSMVGFVAAGLGLLGMRPLDRAISPLLVLSSAWSLVAINRLGDSGLWFGAACDALLLLVGLWRAVAGWPSHPSHRRIWHVAALTAGFCMLGYVGVAAFTYPAHRTWGSTRAELTMPLPGDPEPREHGLEVQHAVTIDAPAEEVWAWLVQLGQDRAGFYSYDWLERAAGLNIHNVREIRPEWQTLQPGDVVHAAQRGYLGGLFGEHPGWTVSAVTPERLLVLDKWGTFALQPIAEERTRFIIRSTMSSSEIPVWASAANFLGFQLPHFIMQRRMMLTIKTLAEERYALRASEDPVRTIDIVATDDMKYSVNTIEAEPGEKLRIRLESKGVIPKVAMAHNVVVLELTTDIDTLLKEGAPYRDSDFIPPAMEKNVIAKTALAGPGERVQITFTVPETPGDYPYLCTFAGHYQAGMKGMLLVKRGTALTTDAAAAR